MGGRGFGLVKIGDESEFDFFFSSFVFHFCLFYLFSILSFLFFSPFNSYSFLSFKKIKIQNKNKKMRKKEHGGRNWKIGGNPILFMRQRKKMMIGLVFLSDEAYQRNMIILVLIPVRW